MITVEEVIEDLVEHHGIKRMRWEKPGTPEELVIHYGAKGMHWGIRKKEEISDRKSAVEKNKKIVEHCKSVVDKAESYEHRLSPEQKKKIAYTLVGAIAVAGIVGGAYYLNKKGSSSIISPYKPRSSYQEYFNTLGKSMSSLGDIPQSSLSRSDFTLPKGHTFFRLSSGPEGTFRSHTYVSTSIDDFNRYVTAIGGSKLRTKLTFQSNKPVKVASTKTVVDILHEIFPKMTNGDVITKEQARSLWAMRMGGRLDDDFSKGVIKELRRRGYSALVDENDIGIFSENPVILITRSGFGKIVSEEMSRSSIGQIHKIVKPVVENLKT